MSERNPHAASLETMRALCEAAVRYWPDPKGTEGPFGAAVAKYIAETTPRLRSKAEVDAEIALVVRHHHEGMGGSGIICISPERERHLKALCSETYGPSGVDSPAVPPAAGPATGATSTEHPDDRPCGCEQSEDLLDRLSQRAKVLSAAYDLAKQLHDLLEETL